MNIREQLITLADIDYKNFHSRLMPTVNPDKLIGIALYYREANGQLDT